jgi:hypothetical protein
MIFIYDEYMTLMINYTYTSLINFMANKLIRSYICTIRTTLKQVNILFTQDKIWRRDNPNVTSDIS